MNDVVLITGAAGGIGSALVEIFSREGYKIAMVYNNSSIVASSILNDLRSRGIDAVGFKADLRNYREVEKMAEAVINRFGKVDILINNAGISQIKLFSDISEDDWDNMMNVNVKSIYNCCKHILPQMISRKFGRIINISSMWGQTGASCEVHYSASKAAVIGFTKALAKEVGLSGITVNCVAPGAIDTPMNDCLSDEDKMLLCDEIPLARLGRTEEIAEVVLFLASNKASYITGQILGVNGGMVI